MKYLLTRFHVSSTTCSAVGCCRCCLVADVSDVVGAVGGEVAGAVFVVTTVLVASSSACAAYGNAPGKE